LSYNLIKYFKHTPKPASFERIRIRILSRWLLNKDEHCSVIAFTAITPREGISTTVAGLARSFSSTDIEKVLVLDVSNSHHKNSVATMLDITKPVDDSDLLGRIRITRDENLGIDVMTFTNDASNAGTTKHTVSLLEKLRKNYNIILIDAGTLHSSAGTYWLVNSDYNILIIDSTKTTSETLEFQKKEFEGSDISIDGSILNKREFHIPRALYWLTR
jgi:Mrp family chromosome partitioning ATPase